MNLAAHVLNSIYHRHFEVNGANQNVSSTWREISYLFLSHHDKTTWGYLCSVAGGSWRDRETFLRPPQCFSPLMWRDEVPAAACVFLYLVSRHYSLGETKPTNRFRIGHVNGCVSQAAKQRRTFVKRRDGELWSFTSFRHCTCRLSN